MADMKIKSYKGATRDLTSLFKKHKSGKIEAQEKVNAKFNHLENRFKVRRGTLLQADMTGGRDNLSSPMSTLEGETAVNDKNSLLPSSAMTKTSTSDENSGSGSDRSRTSSKFGTDVLPPEYVDIQDDIDCTLTEVEVKMSQLQQLQNKRIKESFFEEDKQLQFKIGSLAAEITNSIKHTDAKIKELGRVASEGTTKNSPDFQICKNMQMVFAERLKSHTFEFRRREKSHYAKVKEFESGEADNEKGDNQDDLQGQMQEIEQDNQQSNEIQNLVKTINDLAVLFKDLSDLVIEQGTILDRIDFNIIEAKEDTKKANKHLKKTIETTKSTRSRSVLMCLTIGILICVLILVLRLT